MAKQHYRPELKAHLSGGVPPTPPTSPPPPRPPTFPPPQCPPQDTTGTALSASSTKNRKADYHVQPQKTSQGLRPVRPPPPPPTKARHLTRQKTIDEYQSTVEPMYVEPDELHIRAKTEPAEEPLYITVLPDPPFNTQPQRLHHSVSESPDGPWSNSISPSPPVPAERQKFQHQLSLPARLPQGLETSRHISKEELEILLEWWNTAKETERIYHQFDENNLTMISNEAHRVRLALHLFEGLLFFRGQIFNDHITQLYCMADKLDELHKKTRIAGIAGGTSGAVGGVAVVAGLALAPFTFGASLVATAVGIGVAAVGGVTGASMAIKNKMSNTKERKRVEEIMQNYKIQMEDVEACLNFVSTGMECLMKCNLGILRGIDKDAMRVLRLAQVVGSQSISVRANGWSSGVLDGFTMSMDIYFSKEDQEQLKKGSETKFARKIRELAKQLKSGLDQLIQVRDTVRSAVQQVAM
ncbi:hypothetical protein AALO_G00103010 [Alosa alosa]|uniref:Uncharacterized protein n=1 Tax=Alosa alosa TaxID=278164 RepID=A0AAV6GZA0_9TELE|nr:uncharacterized protein LOC125296968 [Alosa alosa]KAG5278811.1 hypothetical protein AALO_G00103010 [Alosa alosa]